MIEYIVLSAFAILLGGFLLGTRRTTLASLTFAGLVAFTVLGFLEMQARPKPIGAEWRSTETAEVFWYELKEGESITLLLDIGGPRLYILPWSKGQAEQLLRAARIAEGIGGTLMMKNPFEPSLDKDSIVFYAPPQPAPPTKTR